VDDGRRTLHNAQQPRPISTASTTAYHGCTTAVPRLYHVCTTDCTTAFQGRRINWSDRQGRCTKQGL